MAESAAVASSAQPASSNPNAKITKDLETLKEKMDLCQTMLNPGGGTPKLSVHSNDAMLAVIGFLEACAPRMIELVEAASMSGVLSETVFGELLQCNDRLQKILADVETAALTETSAETTAASAAPAAAGSTNLMDQFGDLLLDEPAKPAATAAPATEATDDGDMKQPATIPVSTSDDEFDAFFAG
ncbi:MAG: hypothetical protein SGARI_001690, partial [Bacillariaceae sp.]